MRSAETLRAAEMMAVCVISAESLTMSLSACSAFFFFNDTATTEIYTLSLHDALPISSCSEPFFLPLPRGVRMASYTKRSEEHTSELQSRQYLVCRLLLEKKKKTY